MQRVISAFLLHVRGQHGLHTAQPTVCTLFYKETLTITYLHRAAFPPLQPQSRICYSTTNCCHSCRCVTLMKHVGQYASLWSDENTLQSTSGPGMKVWAVSRRGCCWQVFLRWDTTSPRAFAERAHGRGVTVDASRCWRGCNALMKRNGSCWLKLAHTLSSARCDINHTGGGNYA